MRTALLMVGVLISACGPRPECALFCPIGASAILATSPSVDETRSLHVEACIDEACQTTDLEPTGDPVSPRGGIAEPFIQYTDTTRTLNYFPQGVALKPGDHQLILRVKQEDRVILDDTRTITFSKNESETHECGCSSNVVGVQY